MRGLYELVRVIVLFEGAFVVGLTLYIFRLSGKQMEGRPVVHGGKRYVVLMAAAHITAIIYIMADVWLQIRNPHLTIRTPAAFGVFTLTLYAMHDMVEALRVRMLARLPDPETVAQ